MSAGRGRGRGRIKYASLRKPGENLQQTEVESEEKPPVQTTVGLIEDRQEQVARNVSSVEFNLDLKEQQDKKTNPVLLRAVNNPEFVPRACQQSGALNPIPSSSFSASAVHAPEFVPGKPFLKYEEIQDERIKSIKRFVTDKTRQVMDDPGLLEEISTSMANYLSLFIKVEADLKTVSDLLFETCVSEKNFQYVGSRLANYLDKWLIPQGLPDNISFRTAFLTRCKEENAKVSAMIQNNPDQASNFAIFLGELLMNYKTVKDEPINIFHDVVSSIITEFLETTDRKLLICTGKLLKLAGHMLDENQEEIFQKVEQMATDPNMDRTAQILFSRVCELRSTNWGRDDKPSQSSQSLRSGQSDPLYLPDIDVCLEEQSDELPVCAEEQWNEFAIDGEEEETSEDYEDLMRRISIENYGYYPPYATADNCGSGALDENDYYEEYESFLRANRPS